MATIGKLNDVILEKRKWPKGQSLNIFNHSANIIRIILN